MRLSDFRNFFLTPPLTINRSQPSEGEAVRRSKGNRSFFEDFCNAKVLSEKENPIHRATMSSQKKEKPKTVFHTKNQSNTQENTDFFNIKEQQ